MAWHCRPRRSRSHSRDTCETAPAAALQRCLGGPAQWASQPSPTAPRLRPPQVGTCRHASFATPGSPYPTPASAEPSTLHGTQAPHPPVPSATAVPPTAVDVAAAGHRAAAAPAVGNAAAALGAAAATATAAVASPPAPIPPAPPGAAAAAHSGGTTGTTRLPSCSQRDPRRVDPLLYLPWGAIGGGRVCATPACALCSCRCRLGYWGACRSQRCVEAGKIRRYFYRRAPLCPPFP